jgi:hypothetical protein
VGARPGLSSFWAEAPVDHVSESFQLGKRIEDATKQNWHRGCHRWRLQKKVDLPRATNRKQKRS